MSDPQPGTAVVRSATPPPPIIADRPPTALLADENVINQIKAIAVVAFSAGGDMIPSSIKSKEQAAAVMLAGWEMGLRPWTALRHVYMVNGKTEVETRAMVGIIRARDPRIVFSWPEYTAEAVTCVLRRPGQQPVTVRYTLADANASGQTRLKKQWREVWEGGKKVKKQVEMRGPWQLYPRDMLYAAATKRACRLGAPDLINAIEGRAVSVEIVDAEYRDVTDEAPAPSPSPTSAHPDYNEGDEPDGPLPAEAEYADGDWESLGETADAEGSADTRSPAEEHPPAAEAGAPPADATGDPDDEAVATAAAAPPAPIDDELLKQARATWGGIVRDYAPPNVKRLREKFAGKKKVSTAGNPAFTQYTRAELEQAMTAMQEFIASASRQGSLGDA